MRKKRNPKFKVAVVYKETTDAKDRLRQLWDLLTSLPDPDKAESENKKGIIPCAIFCAIIARFRFSTLLS